VLDLLTKYLLQYRKVSIPHVGTLEIIQKSAELNFIDRLIFPPVYEAYITKEVAIPEHQIHYLASVSKYDKEKIAVDLESLGEKLQKKFESGSFTWKGIGEIRAANQAISIDTLLTPITAEKIMRSNADHSILVGDQERSSTELSEALLDSEDDVKKRSLVITIGWIVLVLTIAFIIYMLYIEGFTIYGAGLKTAP